MGAGPLKKGAVTPLSRKKGVPAKIIIPKCTVGFTKKECIVQILIPT
jgi:hypothetical protein